jgi:hypothetical protein
VLRIPLGVYSLDEAKRIVDNVAKNRQYPERHPYRVNYWIQQRARGKRNIYIKDASSYNGFRSLKNGNGDIPLKYAQKVSLYLCIPNPKVIVENPPAWQIQDNQAMVKVGRNRTIVPLFAVQEVVQALERVV